MKKYIIFIFLMILLSNTAYAEKSGMEIAELFFSGQNEPAEIPAEKPTGGICGENITWKLGSDGVMIIEGTGDITSGWKNDTRIKNVLISDGINSICESAFEGCFNLKKIMLPEKLNSIGARAFSECTNLENITLSDNITSIGSEAFSGCANIKNIHIPPISIIHEGLFRNCSSLSDITISENIVNISESAFENCKSLNHITLPKKLTSFQINSLNGCTALKSIAIDENNRDFTAINGILFNKDQTVLLKYPAGKTDTEYTIDPNITSIGADSFRDCQNITEISFPENAAEIGSAAFRNSALKRVNIGENIKTIGIYAFADCTALNEAVLSAGADNISAGMFYGCSSLTEITLPDNIIKINERAFAGCTALSNITLPDSLEEIGIYVFSGCTHLTGIDIPASAANISNTAFYGCTNMKYINISPENENYISEDGVWFDANKKELIKYPPKKAGDSYIIPASAETIGFAAFEDSSLSSVSFAASSKLKNIENEAFCRCKQIERIVLPKGTISIGDRAFMGCIAMKSLDISKTLESLGDSVFDNCIKLEYLDIPEKTSHIGKAVFYNCPCLYDIQVDPKNKSYMSENGILFNKRQTTLIQYPADKWDTEYTIPDKVTEIEWYAFYRCTELEYVVIPEKVTNIGYQVFYGCKRLTDIYVNEENEYYSSIEGVLFDKNCSELIQYPSGRYDETIYEVPEGTVSIYPYAFYNAQIDTLVLPDTLREIGLGAFYRCKNLKTLTMPASVDKIGAGSFYSCDNLTGIQYGGTADQWQQVIKTTDTDNINMNCTDSTIPAKEISKTGTLASGKTFSAVKKDGKIILSADENIHTAYAALSDDDGIFIKAYILEPVYSDGILTYEHNIDSACNIELMLWDENMSPLTEKIPLD